MPICWIPTASIFGGGAKDTSQESNLVKKTGFMVKTGQSCSSPKNWHSGNSTHLYPTSFFSRALPGIAINIFDQSRHFSVMSRVQSRSTWTETNPKKFDRSKPISDGQCDPLQRHSGKQRVPPEVFSKCTPRIDWKQQTAATKRFRHFKVSGFAVVSENLSFTQFYAKSINSLYHKPAIWITCAI